MSLLSNLTCVFQEQRIHHSNRNCAPRNASILSLLSKCEAIVRSYDKAEKENPKNQLLSKASKKKSTLDPTVPVVDADGFVTVVYKRGRSTAASLNNAPRASSGILGSKCLFPFYDPDDQYKEIREAKTSVLVPNFYKDLKRKKNYEDIKKLRQEFAKKKNRIAEQRKKRTALK